MLLVLCAPSRAQVPGVPVANEAEAIDNEAAVVTSSVPEERSTPRRTFRTFLEAFSDGRIEEAVACLDFGDLSQTATRISGPSLARDLKSVIDRLALVDFDEVPDEALGPPFVWSSALSTPIEIRADERGEWRFSSTTVTAIPTLLQEVTGRSVVQGVRETPRSLALWIRERVPEQLLGGGFLLESWQWIGLFVLIFVGIFVDWLVRLVSRGILGSRIVASVGLQDPALNRQVVRPIGLAAMAGVWAFGLPGLGLPPLALAALHQAVKLVAIFASVWLAYRVIDVLSAAWSKRAQRTESRFDDQLVPLFRKSAKVFVVAFGIVFLADNLGLEITALLAGLGLGGVALALAAQDVVKNLFGSITVLLDRPFQVGDWIETAGVEGTVEEVGFRSTRIRTFYNSLISLPNANLISASVDNFGAREFRRWKTTVGLTYDTPPERIDAFCEGIRELVRVHPYTRKDSFHIYLNEFGAHSLDVLIYVFFKTPDWATELRERHRLGIDILRLAHDLGVSIAFPTQTLHLERTRPTEATDYPATRDPAVLEGRSAGARLVSDSLHGEVPPPVGPAADRPKASDV